MHTCPLGLNCVEFSDNLEKCDNDGYCSLITASWRIPYQYTKGANSDGSEFGFLIVVLDIDRQYYERPDLLIDYGWYKAVELPYEWQLIDGVPAKVVTENLALVNYGEADYYKKMFSIGCDLDTKVPDFIYGFRENY